MPPSSRSHVALVFRVAARSGEIRLAARASQEFAEQVGDINLGDEIAGGASELTEEVGEPPFASRYLVSARCYPFPETGIIHSLSSPVAYQLSN
jgi:hypothetical protein